MSCIDIAAQKKKLNSFKYPIDGFNQIKLTLLWAAASVPTLPTSKPCLIVTNHPFHSHTHFHTHKPPEHHD